MKKLITILLLLIVITSSAQYRTYNAYCDYTLNKKTTVVSKSLPIQIYWNNNDATNINNILRIRFGKTHLRIINDFTMIQSTDAVIVYKASAKDDDGFIVPIYFSKNPDYNETRFVVYFITDNSCLMLYSDLAHFKF